jgi:polysaccharide biosynthesis protein PslG
MAGGGNRFFGIRKTTEKHKEYMECREGRKGLRAGILAVAVLSGCISGSPVPATAPGTSTVTKPVSFAILEDYDKGQDLREVARDFSHFRELGIVQWRGSFGWDDYEPSPGRYDFDWLERFVALADTMGISLRPYLGYTPAWAARGGKDDHAWNDPPRSQQDWVRFAGAVAGRLRKYRSILSYEIYNEENTSLWWEGSAEEYARVLTDGADAIRRADPDAQVFLGGMVWPDLEWLEHACEDGRASFDVLPFHAYPETWTPDSITVENYLGPAFRGGFVPEADNRCGRKPIWINETGFATTPGKSEKDQAEWWARALATFLAEPRVEQIGIYEIKDQPLGTAVIGDAPNYYLGLIRRDGNPKLAFETIRLLVRLFNTDSITVADPLLRVRVTAGSAGQLHQHLFIRPDGRQLVFVWDKSGSPTVELKLPASPGTITAYAIDGRSSPWKNVEGNTIRGIALQPGSVRIFLAGGPVTSR